jgi:hypothetical protein
MPSRGRQYRPETSMVRRGSTVRVRQRALRRPRKRGLFVLEDIALRSACSGMESVMERRDPETSPALPLAERAVEDRAMVGDH